MSLGNEQCRILVEQGRLTEDQARYSLQALQGQHIDLCELLVTWGHIGESTADMVRLLVTQGSQPKVFGNYEILGELSRGGMGVVYRARHSITKKIVALKLMLDGSDAEEALRFRREAQALAKLNHPNVVPIYDFGYSNDIPFFTMELIEGKDLHTYIQEEIARSGLPPHWQWTCQTVSKVANALVECHKLGLFHRDIKPQNILIRDRNETPVLVDFGLVKVNAKTNPGESMALSLTAEGQLIGTPSFMAPEQFDARKGGVGAPADVWALTATLFFALTGTRPFEGENPVSIFMNMKKGIHKGHFSKLPPGAPNELISLLTSGFELDPSARLTMTAFHEQLSDVLVESAPSSKKGIFALLALLPILLWLGFQFFSMDERREEKGSAASMLEGAEKESVKGAFELRTEPPILPEMSDRSPLSVSVQGTTLLSVWLNGERVEHGKSRFYLPLKGLLGEVNLKIIEASGNLKEYDFKVVRWTALVKALQSRSRWERLPEWKKVILGRELARDLGDAFQFDSVQEFRLGARRQSLVVIVHKRTGYGFHLLPGDRFQMGSVSLQETFRFCKKVSPSIPKNFRALVDLEVPSQMAEVKPFLIGRHEVSRGIWNSVLNGQEIAEFEPGQVTGDLEPVMGLHWENVVPWLEKVGDGFRFPLEREWEYACRAGTKTHFFWGDEGEPRANCRVTGKRRVEPVAFKIKRMNAFGLVHMSGNVSEWMAEPFYRYDKGREKFPDNTSHILKGGSYLSALAGVRSGTRRKSMKREALRTQLATGFRVAMDLPKGFLKN